LTDAAAWIGECILTKAIYSMGVLIGDAVLSEEAERKKEARGRRDTYRSEIYST